VKKSQKNKFKINLKNKIGLKVPNSKPCQGSLCTERGLVGDEVATKKNLILILIFFKIESSKLQSLLGDSWY